MPVSGQNSAFLAWIHGHGHLPKMVNNPDVSVSANSSGRLQLVSVDATPIQVAEDFCRYMNAKGTIRISQERFNLILNSAGWAKYFDPFGFRVDGNSVVFRSSWSDAWEVKYVESRGKWDVKRIDDFDSSIHDGWKLVVPIAYRRYIDICQLRGVSPVSKSQYGINWLSNGMRNLRDDLGWMQVTSGPSERDEWAAFLDVASVAEEWIRARVSLTNAKRLSELSISVEQYSRLRKFLSIERMEGWVHATFSFESILYFAERRCSLEHAIEWRNRAIASDDEAAIWIQNQIPIQVAESFILSGCTTRESLTWALCGVMSFDEAQKWTSIKLDPISVSRWKDVGFNSTDDVEAWLKVTVDPSQAVFMRENNFEIFENSPENYARGNWAVRHKQSGGVLSRADLHNLSANGVLISTVLNDASIGRVSIDQSIGWRLAGFEPEESTKWISVGIDSDTAKRYRKFGFGPNQTRDLLNSKTAPTRALSYGVVPTGQ